MEIAQQFQDVLESAKTAHYAMALDENLRSLKAGLKDEGYNRRDTAERHRRSGHQEHPTKGNLILPV